MEYDLLNVIGSHGISQNGGGNMSVEQILVAYLNPTTDGLKNVK